MLGGLHCNIKEESLVYCSKYAALNSDDAAVCSKHDIPLPVNLAAELYWQNSRCHESGYRQKSKKSLTAGLWILGIIMVLRGLDLLFPELSAVVPWWYIFMIGAGLWLVYIGIRQSRRQT